VNTSWPVSHIYNINNKFCNVVHQTFKQASKELIILFVLTLPRFLAEPTFYSLVKFDPNIFHDKLAKWAKKSYMADFLNNDKL